MAIANLIHEINQRRMSANVANSANAIKNSKPTLAKLAILAPVIDVQTQPIDIFEAFFEQAEQAGLELLSDDKRWLKSFGYVRITNALFEQYIKCWLDSMNDENKAFKKQNKGRFAANTFLREIMENGN
ncbi:hypothetical protein [Legionella longbeachae]|uniref:hypothetical protein n=1 Tax=Legionella longbeachae TaxID=450 RepID=UPI001404F995|nr:hypothetical protein [Legionella longbeachae]QIN37132.1 hypothetical protein GCS73_16625 [Legionella longbeachae]